MPNLNSFEEIPRKDLHVFYILDTSGSMYGAKISSLNRAMEETLEALQSVAQSNADAKLKLAVMQFNTNPSWVTWNGPEDLESDFIWEPLTEGGTTNMAPVLRELNAKLSRSGWLNSMAGAMMPILIFMTDGYATDEAADYVAALEEIRRNKWFQRATKIGFAIGDDADENMIAEIVGTPEAVIKTNDLEIFKKLMKFVSVTTSMLASQSVIGKASDAADIVRKAKVDAGMDVEPIVADVQTVDTGSDWDDGGW